MKTAICFYGTISNKIASVSGIVDYNTELIDFEFVGKEFIIPNLIEPNNADVFIHCWAVQAEEKMKKLYNPISSKFELNENYKNEFESKTPVKTKYAINRRSFFFSIKTVLQLVSDHEKEIGLKYDRILLYRPDVAIIKKIRLSEIDLKSNVVISNNGVKHFGDFHYIMDSDTSRRFSTLYDNINPMIDYEPISMPVTLATEMGIEIRQGDILAGRDQEVYRPDKIVNVDWL
jgi:hypothetical protein